ncbi:hypothetical protein K438DRAFT_1267392 [Mycena galopus ATCC 62051]|nr:hypothetical protein K438DRAFT_1267392 [Mycena galopus ATCC 62051]
MTSLAVENSEPLLPWSSSNEQRHGQTQTRRQSPQTRPSQRPLRPWQAEVQKLKKPRSVFAMRRFLFPLGILLGALIASYEIHKHGITKI